MIRIDYGKRETSLPVSDVGNSVDDDLCSRKMIRIDYGKRESSLPVSDAGDSQDFSSLAQGDQRTPYSNCATANFFEVIKFTDFIDKTLFIKAVLEYPDKMIFITAPRRFGKSTIMDMIQKFVGIEVDENGVVIKKESSFNYWIFKKKELLISKEESIFEDHFGSYPVLYINFKDMTGNSYEEITQNFKLILQDSFESHEYLSKSPKLNERQREMFDRYLKLSELNMAEVTKGLRYLSKCLFKHFGKRVFVLIDEYDTPINTALDDLNVSAEEVNKFICSIFKALLKSGSKDDYVERALLTGISYYASVGLSGANNVQKLMFLGNHPFVKFYGLTSDEFEYLLRIHKIDAQAQLKVKHYYNGYCSMNKERMYSIWSVLSYLKTKKLGSYWEESGIAAGLSNAVKLNPIRSAITGLCLGKTVHVKILKKIELKDIQTLKKICLQEEGLESVEVEDPSLYLNFLLQQGYLTLWDVVDEAKNIYQLVIPNVEIEEELQQKLHNYYLPTLDSHVAAAADAFKKLSPSSPQEDFQEFLDQLKVFWDKAKGRILKSNEDCFHCFLFYLLFKAGYFIGSEYPINKKRIDLLLFKENLGIIIELKYEKNSLVALEQILEKYVPVFKLEDFKNIKYKMYIGLNSADKFQMSVLLNVMNVKKRKIFESK